MVKRAPRAPGDRGGRRQDLRLAAPQDTQRPELTTPTGTRPVDAGPPTIVSSVEALPCEFSVSREPFVGLPIGRLTTDGSLTIGDDLPKIIARYDSAQAEILDEKDRPLARVTDDAQLTTESVGMDTVLARVGRDGTIWDASGNRELGRVECGLPLDGLLRRHAAAAAYLVVDPREHPHARFNRSPPRAGALSGALVTALAKAAVRRRRPVEQKDSAQPKAASFEREISIGLAAQAHGDSEAAREHFLLAQGQTEASTTVLDEFLMGVTSLVVADFRAALESFHAVADTGLSDPFIRPMLGMPLGQIAIGEQSLRCRVDLQSVWVGQLAAGLGVRDAAAVRRAVRYLSATEKADDVQGAIALAQRWLELHESGAGGLTSDAARKGSGPRSTIPVVAAGRPAIPPVSDDVEEILSEMRTLCVPEIVDERPSGLRWQFEEGLIDVAGLQEILVRQRNIHQMIEDGVWKP